MKTKQVAILVMVEATVDSDGHVVSVVMPSIQDVEWSLKKNALFHLNEAAKFIGCAGRGGE